MSLQSGANLLIGPKCFAVVLIFEVKLGTINGREYNRTKVVMF